MKFGSLQVRQCATAPSDAKAKIIQDEKVKEQQQSKSTVESVQSVLESSTWPAAAQLLSPAKQQPERGPRLKQSKLETAQVIVHKIIILAIMYWIMLLQEAAAANDEDDLDSVDADEDAKYVAFLEELYSPSKSNWQVNEFSLDRFFECQCYQRSAGSIIIRSRTSQGPYGGPYGHPQNRMCTPQPERNLVTWKARISNECFASLPKSNLSNYCNIWIYVALLVTCGRSSGISRRSFNAWNELIHLDEWMAYNARLAATGVGGYRRAGPVAFWRRFVCQGGWFDILTANAFNAASRFGQLRRLFGRWGREGT